MASRVGVTPDAPAAALDALLAAVVRGDRRPEPVTVAASAVTAVNAAPGPTDVARLTRRRRAAAEPVATARSEDAAEVRRLVGRRRAAAHITDPAGSDSEE